MAWWIYVVVGVGGWAAVSVVLGLTIGRAIADHTGDEREARTVPTSAGRPLIITDGVPQKWVDEVAAHDALAQRYPASRTLPHRNSPRG